MINTTKRGDQMKTTISILLFTAVFSFAGISFGQESGLSKDEVALLKKIPANWTEVLADFDGYFIMENCDVSVGTVGIIFMGASNASVFFFFGQESQEFKLASVNMEDDVFYLECMPTGSDSDEKGVIEFMSLENHIGYWKEPFGDRPRTYVEARYESEIQRLPAENCPD